MIHDRLADLFARLEGRHWLGLSASLVLHILVVLLFPEPSLEPKPMTFEVALTPPPASALPTPLSHKLSRETKAKKPPLAKATRQKRSTDSLDLAWKRERQPRRDAPRVSLPAPQVAARSEEQVQRPQAVKPAAQPLAAKASADASEPGLSDPSASAGAQASQPGRDIGVALAIAQSLALAPGRVNGGLASVASGPAAATPAASAGAGGAGMTASQAASGGAGLNVAGQGAGSRDGASSQAQSGMDAQGMRLSASSHLGGLAAVTAAGTSVAAPLAGEAGRASVEAARGSGLAASAGARAAASPLAGAAGGGRGQVLGGMADAEASVASARGGAALPARAGLDASQASIKAQPAGSGSKSAQAQAAAPLAAGTPTVAAGGGSGPSLARLQPTATGAGTGSRDRPAAGPRPGGQPAAGGETSAGGDAAGGSAAAGANGENARKPALQNTPMAASKLIRPDSEAQALDVLAPSSFCPLPGHQPANLPKPPAQLAKLEADKPVHAADNYSLYFPPLAMAQGREGKVTVRVEVLPDGRTGQTLLKQSSGSSLLDDDARNQLTRWRFKPVQRNGRAITSWIDVPVIYRLPNKTP